MQSARSIKVRQAAFDDYAQIAALQKAYGLDSKNEEEWRHIWTHNAAYSERRASLPIGWVLEDENKRVAGYLGNIPLYYEFEGKTLLTAVAHSWVVDSRYRTYALLLLSEYFAQKPVQLFLNATVGPAAADSFAVFKSIPVPVGAWDRSIFWITNYRGFADSLAAHKQYRFRSLVRWLIATGLFLRDTFTKSSPRVQETNLEMCFEFDDRFQVFWDSLRTTKPNVLIGSRTPEALNWHFRYALLDNRAWVVAATRDSQITAYAIFWRYDNPRVGLTRMRLVDYQSLDQDTAALEAMLRWGLRKCRAERIHMLEAIGFHPAKWEVLRESSSTERKLPSWLYYYRTRDEDLAEKLKRQDAWDPSQFDGDASL